MLSLTRDPPRACCAPQDTLQTFYDITRKEVNDLDMRIMSKDREMEVAEDNHRVEARVYSQKVRYRARTTRLYRTPSAFYPFLDVCVLLSFGEPRC